MKALSLITAVISVLIINTGCEQGEIVDTYVFSETLDRGITRVTADIDAANLIISPSKDDSAVVDVDVEYWGRKADLDVSVDGSTLIIDLACRPHCRGDIDVYVPAEVFIDADNGSGDIEITGIDGDIEVHVGSGNVIIDDVVGNLDLEAGSGNVVGQRLASESCTAEAGSGNVKLGFDDMPSNLNARAGSGNVKLAVPSGSYNIDLNAGSGSTNMSNIIHDPRVPRIIQASTGSGNVTLKGR